ncbi:hypothetical protein C2E23DRAFT_908072 [Lenzites betulinus]|nr:hypothetical protein C2E23DRAFT_908072 [Lenzites betulinus]
MPSSPPEAQQASFKSQLPTPRLSPQSVPSGPPSDRRHPESESMSVAFVKGPKRKRLSKVRLALLPASFYPQPPSVGMRCLPQEQTPVRRNRPLRQLLLRIEELHVHRCGRTPCASSQKPQSRTPYYGPITTISPASEPLPWAEQATADAPPSAPQNGIERNPTSKRSRRGQPGGGSSPPSGSKTECSPERGNSALLDPATTHELVNIFFAHCNPQRMILHKPSFSAALSLNKVPLHLVLTVCALAAPLSKSVAAKASHARLAGVPFFQEALSLMFDNSGRLLCEPSVSTAQALCLLEMHEVAASHSWTRHYRYFELALQVLEDGLQVHHSDNTAPPSPTNSEALIEFIDRECTRRCFWLIQSMGWISNIYTRKPILPRMAELADLVRLPIDETTFELAVLSSSATSEYLRRPAPRTRYASQFGHMCRILELYHNVETIIATKDGPERVAAIAAIKPSLDAWHESLPGHLKFTEENLETQVTMFETSSNSGVWCYCFMHAMYPCCYLAILEGQGMLSEPIPWVREQLNRRVHGAERARAGADRRRMCLQKESNRLCGQ